MADHHLLAPDTMEVTVAAPAQGQILMGNAMGRWSPQALGAMSGSFGTPATLTAAVTTLTPVAPGTPDYAIADVTQTTPWGFADTEEARTVLAVVVNLQTRLAQVEAKLKSLGLCV